MHTDEDLCSEQNRALARLLVTLALEERGDDHFVGGVDPAPLFDHIYGGQLLAQAVVGAGLTAEARAVSSLHAAFVQAGDPSERVEIEVRRVRDGRAMATRSVTLTQSGAPIMEAIVSFHDNSVAPDISGNAPEVPMPASTPLLQDWVGEHGRHWTERPPPVELRITEPPTFLGGGGTAPQRSHWMRAPSPVEASPLLHAALLAYASDFFLMDMVFRAHPAELGPGRAMGLSLDHSVWFHRPSRFDEWHLHTQEAIALVGDRGLARGAIHDHPGRLVATVMQEVLVRPLSVR